MSVFDSSPPAPDSPVGDPPPYTSLRVPEEPEDVAPQQNSHDSIVDTPVSLPDTAARRTRKLHTELQAFYTTVATVIFPFDNQTGTVILEQSSQCASALTDLAAKNPRVRAALESLLTTSAWSAVIAAHLPIAVQVATKYVPSLRDQYEQTVASWTAQQNTPPPEQ